MDPGPELGPADQPGNPKAADVAPQGPQLLMDPRVSEEAEMLLERRHDLSGERRVFGHTIYRDFLPMPPGVEATAGQAQLTSQPGHRVTTGQLIDHPNISEEAALWQSTLPPA